MTTVTGKVLRPGGLPVAGATVIIDLVASLTDDQAPGYIADTQEEIWARTTTTTNDVGSWFAELPPTAIGDNVYTQDGLFYAVTYTIGGEETIHYIDVPDSVSTLWIGDLLLFPPGDIEAGTFAPHDGSYLLGTTAGLPNEIVVGATPGGQLGGTWSAPTVDTIHAGGSHVASSIAFTPAGTIAATDVQAAIVEVAAEAGGSGAPTTADYLVGTTQAGLSAEIVVGTTPGGELGGTWGSPTVDATHSGSSHASVQSAAEATGVSNIATHAALTATHGVAGALVGTTDSQALTNKTFAIGSNTVSGSVSDFNAALTSADFYTSGGTDVAITDGGTGQSTATAGFNALSPVSARGDLIVRDATNNVRLPLGGSGTLLRSDGTDAGWASLATAGIQPLDATLTAVAAYNTNGILTQTAADTFAGRTITGTASRLSVSNGSGVSGNPTLDIDSAYVGQTSITTLGTITAGTWTGTTVAVANGGTGGTSQATAQSALNVPPVADVNSSGAVIAVRGNSVDSGTPNFGQAYVWDGDSFNPTSVTQEILSDAGLASLSGTTNETSLMAGTKPDIAANTLAVGDIFRFVISGTMETIGGAASTVRVEMDWDAVEMISVTTAQVAITTAVTWAFTIDSRVVSIGSSGTVLSTITGFLSGNVTSVVSSSYVGTVLATVNTTQALTIDFLGTLQSNNANNTFVCQGITGTYTPKFA